MSLSKIELQLLLDSLNARIDHHVVLHQYTVAHKLAVLRDKVWKELEKTIETL
jgi:hypothetical protein